METTFIEQYQKLPDEIIKQLIIIYNVDVRHDRVVFDTKRNQFKIFKHLKCKVTVGDDDLIIETETDVTSIKLKTNAIAATEFY